MSAQAQVRAWLDWSITIPLTVRRAHHYELRRSLSIETLLGDGSIPAYPSSHTSGLAEFKDDHHSQSDMLCRVLIGKSLSLEKPRYPDRNTHPRRIETSRKCRLYTSR